MYTISSWILSTKILRASELILMDEFFIFDNIKEKSIKTVEISNCSELKWNLEEFKKFVSTFGKRNNMQIIFKYNIVTCTPTSKVVNMELHLLSGNIYMNATYTYQKP